MALSVEEVSGKEHAAKLKRLELNSLVYEASVGTAEGIYKVLAIGDAISLQLMDTLADETPEPVQIPFDAFLKSWKPFVGDLVQKLSGDWGQFYAGDPMRSSRERHRAALFLALHDMAQSVGSTLDQVYMTTCPTALRAATDIKKDKLQLVPAIPSIANILQNDPTPQQLGHKMNYIQVQIHDGTTLCIARPSQSKAALVEKWGKSDKVDPFWWVAETHVEEDVNMVLKFTKFGGHKLPMLVNTKAVKKNQALLVYRPKNLKRKLADAIVDEDQDAANKGKAAKAS